MHGNSLAIRIASPLRHRLSNPTREFRQETPSASSFSSYSRFASSLPLPPDHCAFVAHLPLLTHLHLFPLSIPWFRVSPPIPPHVCPAINNQQWPTTTTTISLPPRPRASRLVRRRLSRSTRSLVSYTPCLHCLVHYVRAINHPIPIHPVAAPPTYN